MREIINWLLGVEELAGEVYRAAADEFAGDENFHRFLSQLAEDEAWHFHVIGNAARYFDEMNNAPASEIILNAATCAQIEAPLRGLHSLILNGSVSRQDVVNCIAKTEFFECNEIFTYIIDLLKERARPFEYAAAIIEAHKDRVLQFFKHLPPDLLIPAEVWELPTIWDKRILVVDDTEAIRLLLERLLSRLGVVETAADGAEALPKIKAHFYNIIISDIVMPGLNGIEFYQQAVAMDPAVGNHFLFCSGDCPLAARQFIRERGLPFLAKPFELSELRGTVQSIMENSLAQVRRSA